MEPTYSSVIAVLLIIVTGTLFVLFHLHSKILPPSAIGSADLGDLSNDVTQIFFLGVFIWQPYPPYS